MLPMASLIFSENYVLSVEFDPLLCIPTALLSSVPHRKKRPHVSASPLP